MNEYESNVRDSVPPSAPSYVLKIALVSSERRVEEYTELFKALTRAVNLFSYDASKLLCPILVVHCVGRKSDGQTYFGAIPRCILLSDSIGALLA